MSVSQGSAEKDVSLYSQMQIWLQRDSKKFFSRKRGGHKSTRKGLGRKNGFDSFIQNSQVFGMQSKLHHCASCAGARGGQVSPTALIVTKHHFPSLIFRVSRRYTQNKKVIFKFLNVLRRSCQRRVGHANERKLSVELQYKTYEESYRNETPFLKRFTEQVSGMDC